MKYVYIYIYLEIYISEIEFAYIYCLKLFQTFYDRIQPWTSKLAPCAAMGDGMPLVNLFNFHRNIMNCQTRINEPLF